MALKTQWKESTGMESPEKRMNDEDAFGKNMHINKSSKVRKKENKDTKR